MSSSSKKPRTKASSSRKRQAGDDEAALAVRSTERAESSTAITRPQQRDRIELDGRPFQYAQLHAESARNPSHSEQTRGPERMASSDNHTAAPGTSHPTPTSSSSSSSTRPTQEQTSIPERHQTLRDLFRTRLNQPSKLPQDQRGSMTEPYSTQPHPQPPNPSSTPTTHHPSEEYPLEEIDLRSPTDDPEYDFISPNEALHSSRNAQPDHASKYTTTTKRSSSTSSRRRSTGEESDEEEESDGELASWRTYDYVKESEAKFSARNASSDHASKYPELRGKETGGEGERNGEKGWLQGWLS